MRTLALQLNNLFTKSELAVKTKEGVLQFGPALVINTILLTAGVLLMLYYIMGANGMTSDNYKVKLMNDRLTQLNEEQSTLLAQKAGLEESLVTLNFAKSHSMVEAKNITYLFEARNVAQR